MKELGVHYYKNRIISLFLVLVLMACFVLPGISVKAATTKIGTVTAESLSFRAEPNLNGKILGYLSKGDSAEILDEATDDRPVVWYKMTIDGVTGWASSSFISVKEIQTSTGTDIDFEAYLNQEGFPESYKAQLRTLHELYPNWVFEAQHTGLDWDEVIDEEYALGRNLVWHSSIASWKSTQSGAYNWETGKWIGLDGSSWVAASKEIIAYYMDPRNFLSSTNVFQFLKQSYDPDYMTAEQVADKRAGLELMVDGTFLEGTYTEGGKTISYVDTLMTAAERSGVCPLTLASMIIQEQGTQGTGKSISGTVSGYVGYYNYFNVGAYATSTMTAVQRGLWYASGSGVSSTTYNRPWNTRTASIIGGAMYYGSNYVAVGQDTMYLKKFNVQGNDMYNHQYMTNVQGAASEGQHIADGYSETARQAALVFKIPVFENMPSTAVTKPTGDLNPNYMLKSLSVSGYSLTPTFDIYETEYAVTVPNGVSSVTVSATTVASTTTVTGTGTKSLNVGTNKFTIKSTAQNGDSRTYTLTIVRKVATNAQPVSVNSSSYSINSNNTITGIKSFPVSTSGFLKNFTVTNGTIKVLNADGTVITGNVGTGDQVKVYDTNDSCKYTYDVIIYGDTNGDGNINPLDLLRVQKDILGISKLSGFYSKAGDTSKDGNINALDLLQVQKQILSIKAITQ